MLSGPAVGAILVGLFLTLRPASCQLSQEQINTIVELHNRYRGQVVPSASYMTKLKWDEKLKIIAEGYAVNCVWEHNPDLLELNLGENLFVMDMDFDPNKAMDDWFNEHRDYNYKDNSCQDGMMCGHYTQMVWANTQLVGCASHRCETMEGLTFQKVTFLVCNYFPPGNLEDTKPYVEGEWCSNCTESRPQCDQNLCVPYAPEPVDEEKTMESSSPQTTGMATESSAPGSSPQTTGMATDVKEPKPTQTTHIPTVADMTRQKSVANTGGIATLLTLVSSLVTLLMLWM
ncbi:hypothetical protein UPYG_G00009980 [Umbra pygmaea]|uniref:SCP domain-containing protein n=1 Tax=Umbra pygmaea TaxID=75934 RepID=A0ABD0XIB9_UMBPY